MACCALWVSPGATPLMLAMLPTVIVVAVTPVAVAPPLPPAGAWLPFAPHAPEPDDTPARAAGLAPPVPPPVAPGLDPEEPPLPGAPLARAVPLDEHGAVVVVVDVDAADFALVVVVVDFDLDASAAVVVVVDDDVQSDAVDPRASAPVPVPVPEPAVPEWPAPWASAAWLPLSREPQADATSARTTTDSATATRWRFRIDLIGRAPRARCAATRPGCARSARAGRPSGRWRACCGAPLRSGACSRRSARGRRHRSPAPHRAGRRR